MPVIVQRPIVAGEDPPPPKLESRLVASNGMVPPVMGLWGVTGEENSGQGREQGDTQVPPQKQSWRLNLMKLLRHLRARWQWWQRRPRWQNYEQFGREKYARYFQARRAWELERRRQMKILILCDQGNNRSVVLAHQLKYWGHDVIPAGLKTNSRLTLQMLCDWADRIIITEACQRKELVEILSPAMIAPSMSKGEIQLWNIGPDKYPRPFNSELLAIVRRLMEEHREEYKQK